MVNKDSNNGASYSGRITITPDPNRDLYPAFDPIAKQTAFLGEPFSLNLANLSSRLSATRVASTTYTATGLPPNLSLNTDTGLISGIVQLGGTYPIRVQVINTYGLDEADFLLDIPGTVKGSSVFAAYH